MKHESRKTVKLVVIIILIALSIRSLIAGLFSHWFFIPLSLALAFFLVFVRFKKLEIIGGQLLYEDKSILPFLNTKEAFTVLNIVEVEEVGAHTDKKFIVHDLIGLRCRGNVLPGFVDQSNSYPETLILRFKDDTSFSTTRFGTKRGFKRIAQQIKTVANSAQSQAL